MRIFVKGVGLTPLPLTNHYTSEIKKKCKLAPFGKNSETIIDTNVRSTYELESNKVEFKNERFLSNLNKLCEITSERLQINKKVKLELHRLLLYEPGSFFLPHRDTEKHVGMFATLVVLLPCESNFVGGELVVEHEKQSLVFPKNGPELFRLQACVFFCNCLHELKKVSKGNRLALVFNVFVEDNNHVTIPKSTSLITNQHQNELLNNWRNDRAVCCLLLKHMYSLSLNAINALKGNDHKLVKLMVDKHIDELQLKENDGVTPKQMRMD